jgi:N4-gp56 family major capsid protein
MTQIYGNGTNSSIGEQLVTEHYAEALVLKEVAKKEVFGKLANTFRMPKNKGKTIEFYHYMPLLSDININDQGIDANGLTTSFESTIEIKNPALKNVGNEWVSYWAVGNHASVDATAIANAKAKAVDIFKRLGVFNTDYATTKAALLALNPPWVITENASVNGAGNLYGSSKDPTYITSKMPVLGELGGYVNRVGSKRIKLTGTFAKYGFYTQWSEESELFDSDVQLATHRRREVMYAASEIQEDLLQIDLLNSAGVVIYGGSATSKATISGEVGSESLLTYDDFVKLDIQLDINRCPRNTTVVTGSKMTDTKTINSARFMYVAPQVVSQLTKMVDNFGLPALTEYRHYADRVTEVGDELGSIRGFRIIVHQEMMVFEGAGATVSNNAGYMFTGNKYDVYPLLVVGDESFTTIGFKTGGKGSKVEIHTFEPKSQVSFSNDPYGSSGFTSLQWYYGFVCFRPERIAMLLTVAEY